MKTKLLAIVAAAAALALTAHAQTMTEYSAVTTQASKALAAPAPPPPTTHVVTVLSGAPSVPKSKGAAIWVARNTGTKLQPSTPPKPAAPAVFILSNGERLESNDYLLTVDSLQIVQNDNPRTIPLTAVNLEATVAANRQRGIDLKIPANKAQIMLSF